MPITLNIQVESAAQLRDEVRALAEAFGAQTLPAEDIKAIADAKSQREDDAAREKLQADRDAAKEAKATKSKSKPKDEPKPEAEAPADEEPAALDFDKDVAPLALKLVADKGREALQGILEEYGVARASQIEDSLLPEFVAKVQEALS